MSVIVINATAIRSSGALTILRQFIETLSVDELKDEYYVFIDPGVRFKTIRNVTYVPVPTSSWLKRIYWDETGLRRWIEKHNLTVDLFISFQNTGAKLEKKVPRIIYYHQPLPLVGYKWNIFKKEELVLFLYQKFYAFFVSRYLSGNSYVTVQIPSVKEMFCTKFGFPEDKVYVIRPDIERIDYGEVVDYPLDSQYIHFIFPATPFVYKNHADIIKAVRLLESSVKNLNIKIHFTFKKNEVPDLYNTILKYGLNDYFVFEGSLPYERLLSLYKSSSALLFPSYIETFGLPLIEAASAGLPVIAMDLPYAKDVIGEYEGAKFIPLHNIEALAGAMLEIIQAPRRFVPLTQTNENNWKYFSQLIDKLKI